MTTKTKVILGLGLVAALGLLLFFRDPHVKGAYPPCVFWWLTGYYCPGCGSTRAIYHLLHLHPLQALDQNPLMVILLPLIVYILAKMVWRVLVNPETKVPELSARMIIVLFWVILIYWVLRNLPWYPFTLLAPTF